MWSQVHKPYNYTAGVNSFLMHNNSFFSAVRENQSLYFLHVTSSKEKILDSNSLNASGGCLVGAIYSTPMFQEGNKLRLHNLGAYYTQKEVPQRLNHKAKQDQTTPGRPYSLIIHMEIEKGYSPHLEGVNYLRLGPVHDQIYKKLSYLLTRTERDDMQSVIMGKISKSLDFIKYTQQVFAHNSAPSDNDEFLEALRNHIPQLPILGYVYFEALTKTLMLHQNDEKSAFYRNLGEFYNWHYKDLMFHLYPNFFVNFKLSDFNPDFKVIEEYVTRNKLVDDIQLFKRDFVFRLIKFTQHTLFDDSEALTPILGSLDRFRSAPDTIKPLIGHMIHRELRNFNRYPDFYFYFDQIKALEAWNYWNRNRIMVPFNGIIPKGEVGINPSYVEHAKYTIYEGEEVTEQDNRFYINKGKKLDVRIVPKLVNYQSSFMRNRYA